MPEIKSVAQENKIHDDIEALKHAENMPLFDDNKLQENLTDTREDTLDNQSESDEIGVDPEILCKLSNGLLANVLPDLQKVQKCLNELRKSQRVIIETAQQENSKFRECQANFNLSSILNKTKIYYTKLVNVKKEMTTLHDKSVKLKKRAMKLKQQKEKEALCKEQQREREAEREKQLIAKMASKT